MPTSLIGHFWEGAPLVIGYVLGRSRRLVHVEHVRRRLGKVRSAGARRGTTTLRLHLGFLQSFQVGGQKGRRFAASGIVLAQEAFETENRVRLGYALRRFMTRRATGCVKLGGSLTSVQIFLPELVRNSAKEPSVSQKPRNSDSNPPKREAPMGRGQGPL